MRLPARRIATTALTAGLLIGLSGPAVMAADGDSVRERTHAASRAPLPDVEELQDQVGSLAGLGGVLTPVTDLLSAVLKADDGRLSATDADQLSAAVKDALAKADAADADADDTATTPGTTTPGTATPGTSTPAQPPAVTAPEAETPVTLPAPVVAQDSDGTAAADALAADAHAALQKQIDALVQAATSGTAEQVTPAVQEVVNGVVNVVAATLVGSGLPAADLAGLPALPSAPEAATPEAAAPANPLPADPA
ncbi:Secreted protein [Streptomyces ambofaciens ATCC 23877]|uniref:Secreted protein n=1 Tax=Streptomyces ambofaciens (strain ATCC 23877 / 3486 / DSM 40053 / JCM 4204 / NBRC 12836 / NRRL B-2516) TaxID=278992 RepID=A0A0K2AS08_STRA7|nr:hypothetical protein [Streptomyces ambofaciens]AKZ55783.1 Secreted protein [Streptomyces ambofaciens ATCC 23877]